MKSVFLAVCGTQEGALAAGGLGNLPSITSIILSVLTFEGFILPPRTSYFF